MPKAAPSRSEVCKPDHDILLPAAPYLCQPKRLVCAPEIFSLNIFRSLLLKGINLQVQILIRSGNASIANLHEFTLLAIKNEFQTLFWRTSFAFELHPVLRASLAQHPLRVHENERFRRLPCGSSVQPVAPISRGVFGYTGFRLIKADLI